MAIRDEYRRWLAGHEGVDVVAVGVVQFYHPAFGSEWVCDYDQDFTGVTEGGVTFTAKAVAIEAQVPDVGEATEQRVTLRMDALAGLVIPKLRALSAADRVTPVKVTLRWYLDNDPARPARDPFDLVCVEVRAVRMVVEFDCAVSPLPNLQAGIRYDLTRFPQLAFI
jgi:hypothetical protein